MSEICVLSLFSQLKLYNCENNDKTHISDTVGHFVNLNVPTLFLKTAQNRRGASGKSPSSPFYFKLSHKYSHSSLKKCWGFQFRSQRKSTYEGWNFNSGNYLFTTDTK